MVGGCDMIGPSCAQRLTESQNPTAAPIATFLQFAFRYYGNTQADAAHAFIWRRMPPAITLAPVQPTYGDGRVRLGTFTTAPTMTVLEERCHWSDRPQWAQSGRERNGDSDGEKRLFVRHSADVPTPQLAREWTNRRVLANCLPAESGKCSKPFSHGASSGAPIRLLLHRGALSMDGFERVVPTRFSGGDRLRLEVEPFPDKAGFLIARDPTAHRATGDELAM